MTDERISYIGNITTGISSLDGIQYGETPWWVDRTWMANQFGPVTRTYRVLPPRSPSTPSEDEQ